MGQAGTAVGGLGALTGPGAGTGAGSIASFQSPYQQQVMDETLRQYDLSRGAKANKLFKMQPLVLETLVAEEKARC